MKRRRFLCCTASCCVLMKSGCTIFRGRKEADTMIPHESDEIAACGLLCGPCPIRRIPFDAKAASDVVSWYRKEGWLKREEGLTEILERSMYCKGCHGDRSIHWDAECWILRCAVDEKGLRNCSECDAFPCNRLKEWSEQGGQYGQALKRLQNMRNHNTPETYE